MAKLTLELEMDQNALLRLVYIMEAADDHKLDGNDIRLLCKFYEQTAYKDADTITEAEVNY